MALAHGAVQAVELIAEMTWDSWWALVLGFGLSGAVEAFVSDDATSDLLGEDDWGTIGLGALLGAASSSCSYSAVGTTKTLFKKGASGAASLGAFMFASTDLVVELGLVMWVLLGWQFVVGEYLGGVVAVVVLGGVFKHVVPPDWIEAAREHVRTSDETVCATCDVTVDPSDPDVIVDDELPGASPDDPVYFCCGGCRRVYVAREGKRADDREAATTATGLRRLLSLEGWRSASRAAIKDWEMLWTDVALGFLVAGLVGGFVPESWWTALIPGETTFVAVVAATLLAIAIGVVTFMCSVGNVPFALVLWGNGLPYGAVLSFVYADLIIPPLANVYRKYYGLRMAATLVAALAVAAGVAGVAVHYVAGALDIVPPAGTVGGTVPDAYTAVLNLVFTPLFLAQVVVTYGWGTLRDRVLAVTTGVAAWLRSFARDAGRTVELTTGGTAAVLGDPTRLEAALDSGWASAEFDEAATGTRRSVQALRASVAGAAAEVLTAARRTLVALEAAGDGRDAPPGHRPTDDDATAPERPDADDTDPIGTGPDDTDPDDTDVP